MSITRYGLFCLALAMPAASSAQNSSRDTAVALPATTTAAERIPAHLQGFYERKAKGEGRFIEPEVFRKRFESRFLDVLHARLPGVEASFNFDATRATLVNKRGPTSFVGNGRRGSGGMSGCVIATYLNGIETPDPGLATLRAADVEAVEYYAESRVPAQFRKPGNQCGVLVIWTR